MSGPHEQSPALLSERGAKLSALGTAPPWWRVFARRRWLRRHAEVMAMDVSVYAEMLRHWYPEGLIEIAASRPVSDEGLAMARELAKANQKATR